MVGNRAARLQRFFRDVMEGLAYAVGGLGDDVVRHAAAGLSTHVQRLLDGTLPEMSDGVRTPTAFLDALLAVARARARDERLATPLLVALEVVLRDDILSAADADASRCGRGAGRHHGGRAVWLTRATCMRACPSMLWQPRPGHRAAHAHGDLPQQRHAAACGRDQHVRVCHGRERSRRYQVTDVVDLAAAAATRTRSYCNLLNGPDAVRTACLEQLMVLLGYPYPKVRFGAPWATTLEAATER